MSTSAPRYESEKVDISPLGQPLHFEFANRDAPNRFMKGAMVERDASWDPKNPEVCGVPSKELQNVYRRWGEGGIGLVLTGAMMFANDHLEAGCPVIPTGAPFEGERFEAFKEMARQGKIGRNLMVGQICHPGRQVDVRIQPNPVSASDVHLDKEIMGLKFGKPHAATQQDIAGFIEGWAYAAEYMEKAGFDGIQLHGAHGYLLAQFLSPTTNKRTDKYGGSLENRARIIVEIAQEIRRRTKPNFILGIKINSVEFQDKGFQPDEAKALASILEANKFDFIELSGGTYESLGFGHKRESTKAREAFFLEFADLICPALAKTKVYLTGGFKTAGAMVGALKTVDGVGLARPVCQEPRFCQDVLDGRVTGAMKLLLDESDYALTNLAAGTQIRQIGRDQEPIDLTKKENVDIFMKDMAVWMKQMGEDTEGEKYGYVDLSSARAVPYGVVEA